jgi:hypothetical protein
LKQNPPVIEEYITDPGSGTPSGQVAEPHYDRFHRFHHPVRLTISPQEISLRFQ